MLKRDLYRANIEVVAYSRIVSESFHLWGIDAAGKGKPALGGRVARGSSARRKLSCNVLIKWRFAPSRRRDTLIKQVRAPISPIGALSADLYPRNLIYLNT